MTLLIFSGWVLVCDGAADIVFFIIMKLGLRKIAKKAEAEKEEAGADSSEAVDDKVDMDTQSDTKTQDGNDPQSGNAPKYSANTAAENMAVETATTEPEKKSRRGILRKKEKVQERTGNSITEQNEQENALKDSSASDFSSENATESTGEPTQDTEGSTNRKVTEEVTPTAPRASDPTKLPTIMESATLYICWNRLPATMGSVKSSMVLAGEPTVMSFAIAPPHLHLY